MSLFGSFFKGNPLASATVASILAAAGAYLTAHFDPAQLTPLGFEIYSVVVAIVGVVVHHANTPGR